MEKGHHRNYIMGIDVGGTKTMIGIIDSSGHILGAAVKIPTLAHACREEILQRIFIAADEALASSGLQMSQLAGIGLGVPGPLDMQNGLVLDPLQLPTWHNFHILKSFQEHFAVPVYLDNDANCYILGESYFGAGKNCSMVLGFTLGTGLGCGIIMNRRIFRGATETAGEVWISPMKDEPIEEYVSGRGITRLFKHKTGKDFEPQKILELAFAGDLDARETWGEFGEHLAFCLAWSINLLDPDIVVLGGSLCHGLSLFYERMESNLRKNLNPVPAERTKVVPSALAADGGFIGAACLVLQKSVLEPRG